jgi:hypothetical protein
MSQYKKTWNIKYNKNQFLKQAPLVILINKIKHKK